jgi:hypothetical protein
VTHYVWRVCVVHHRAFIAGALSRAALDMDYPSSENFGMRSADNSHQAITRAKVLWAGILYKSKTFLCVVAVLLLMSASLPKDVVYALRPFVSIPIHMSVQKLKSTHTHTHTHTSPRCTFCLICLPVRLSVSRPGRATYLLVCLSS